VEPWEVEILRRSVAMLPPGHSAGAVGRKQALQPFDEIAGLQHETRRYREAVDELRGVLDALDVDC
jgi:hypothetical protein